MQKTFADFEYDHRKRKTRRKQLLERMDALTPWGALLLGFAKLMGRAVYGMSFKGFTRLRFGGRASDRPIEGRFVLLPAEKAIYRKKFHAVPRNNQHDAAGSEIP